MKLKDQVCSLELAKKLKELGVKQESLWWHIKFDECGWIIDKYKEEFDRKRNRYSAFTVAELGEMLPDFYKTFRNGAKRWIPDNLDAEEENEMMVELGGYDTEANARAKMLIYLLKNKLTETE